MSKLTQTEVISRLKALFPNYDYSKVNYINSQTKICVICPEHGEFWKKPNDMLCQHQGCPKCVKKVYDTNSFIEQAKLVHGDKYDYSKVEYKGSATKVCIICKKCGCEFWQRPSNHLNGQGCPNKCKLFSCYSTTSFVEQAKLIHGNKYDYSKVEYKTAKTKVRIICPDHGEFWQEPDSHLSGHGCPKCGVEKANQQKSLSLNQFIIRSRLNQKRKDYDYSKVKYSNLHDMITIVCPDHGEFIQEANHHLRGFCGCKRCANIFFDQESFIDKAKEIHGDKYDYSKVEYKDCDSKVLIVCKQCGNEFWQTPHHHIYDECGCPECNISKGENKIKDYLECHNITYIHDKACLPFLGKLRPDFYLPDYN